MPVDIMKPMQGSPNFERMNEEYSHRLMQIGMQPSQLHPFQAMKFALTPVSRLGDVFGTVRLPFTEQRRAFTDIYRTEWGPVGNENDTLLSHLHEAKNLSERDWYNIRMNNLNKVNMSPQLRQETNCIVL